MFDSLPFSVYLDAGVLRVADARLDRVLLQLTKKGFKASKGSSSKFKA